MTRRSFWAWGVESDEPTYSQMRESAAALSQRFGTEVEPRRPPKAGDLSLRRPRISPPSHLEAICSVDSHDRAFHSYGRSFPDRVRAFNLEFPNPPDVVARPSTEAAVASILEWCTQHGYAVIPFGGGSSVVGGVEPPSDFDGVVAIDLERMDRILEIDSVSRAARIQAGTLGPSLEARLKPHGLTLRHFPQSFEYSTLGGWLATRSGGHYATNHTHIDDFAESIRMVTPAGAWESRRLPGSGAGPSPDRMVLGSEGALGVITEAWMRLQARPRYRASAGVTFPTFEAGYEAVRLIVQSKLWPTNLRLLDPEEAQDAAGMDGEHALLIVGFESADVPQGPNLRQAVELARQAGGSVSDDEVLVSDESESDAGRQGPVGQWRESFIRAPYIANTTIALGLIQDTFETSITWDRWPEMDAHIRAVVQGALLRVCGGGTIACRFTHVYPDGPAPYYTFTGLGVRGGEVEMWAEIKQAASDAVIAAGGTITHHHAVGRMHRPWYDRQRPDLFGDVLRAAKQLVDPGWVLNPGVLVDRQR